MAEDPTFRVKTDEQTGQVVIAGMGELHLEIIVEPTTREFSVEAGGVTRVELTSYSEPATPIDRIKEIGAAGWIRRQTKRSLERLRLIFEEPPREPLKRATIAGYEPAKASRFGGSRIRRFFSLPSSDGVSRPRCKSLQACSRSRSGTAVIAR